jgi:hypothetical protein
MKHVFSKQGSSERRSVIPLILATGFAFAWINSAAATEVYTWTDESGIVHYSDVPIDPQETQTITVDDANAPGMASTAPPVQEAQPSVAQQRREQFEVDRKIRKEAQAIIDQLCAEHLKRLTKMEPARRIFYTDDKGEFIRLDDDQRMGLIEESKNYISKNCE